MALRSLFALAVLIVLAACGPSPTPTSTPSTAPATASSQDMAFLARAAMFENFEIQAADLAAAQAGRQAVKDYAAAEGAAHRAALGELTSLATSHAMRAPNDDLDDNFTAYLDMLRRADGATFDSFYASQQALAYINAAGFYDAYARSGANSALKQWAAARLASLQAGVVGARQLAAAP